MNKNEEYLFLKNYIELLLTKIRYESYTILYSVRIANELEDFEEIFNHFKKIEKQISFLKTAIKKIADLIGEDLLYTESQLREAIDELEKISIWNDKEPFETRYDQIRQKLLDSFLKGKNSYYEYPELFSRFRKICGGKVL